MRNEIVGVIVWSGLVLLAGCAGKSDEPWSTKSEPRLPSPIAVLAEEADTGDAIDPEYQDSLHDAAIEVLLQAGESTNELLRANALEAMHRAPQHLEPFVHQGLVDENRGVRFVAAMTIGELRLEGSAHLLQPLLDDDSLSVRAAAIYGLYRCGYPVDLTPLAGMISSDDPEVKANAALVLGELGNPSAGPLIRQAVGQGMNRVRAARVKMVELQLAEALVKLGYEGEIEVIRAALFAPAEEGEITALACMMCGRLKDERAAANLVRLARRTGRFQQSAEVRMAATWALAQINPAQATLAVPMEYVHSGKYQLRAQAALTLGEIGDPGALSTLGVMLGDPNPLVQVAAAGAILRLEPP